MRPAGFGPTSAMFQFGISCNGAGRFTPLPANHRGEACVDFTVDATSSLVTVAARPGIGLSITAGFEFDVPARFDTDRLEVTLDGIRDGDIPAIPVVEIRV